MQVKGQVPDALRTVEHKRGPVLMGKLGNFFNGENRSEHV